MGCVGGRVAREGVGSRAPGGEGIGATPERRREGKGGGPNHCRKMEDLPTHGRQLLGTKRMARLLRKRVGDEMRVSWGGLSPRL